MRQCGEDDAKGMVSDIEGVWSLRWREMSRSIKDGICVCVVVVVVVAVVLVVEVALIVAIGVMGMVVLMVVVGIVMLVMVVRVACIRVVVVVGVFCIGVLEVEFVGVVDILVLGAVFIVEGVEGGELVVRCVLRRVLWLVLWCVNGRGYFFCCFSLKSVKMNGLSVGEFLFGMPIWADCLILLEGRLMVGADILLEVVVVEVVVVETVDLVQVLFFIFSRRCCLGKMDVRVVIEIVVGVVVLVWWRCSVV